MFNYLLGSISRIFTTIQEVDDNLILYGFVAGFVLNLVMAGQMVSPRMSSSLLIADSLIGLLLEQSSDSIACR